MYYNQESKAKGFIIHSNYGFQSHIIMNVHGVVYSCCPYKEEDKVIVFKTKKEAQIKLDELQLEDDFYKSIAQIKFLARTEIL